MTTHIDYYGVKRQDSTIQDEQIFCLTQRLIRMPNTIAWPQVYRPGIPQVQIARQQTEKPPVYLVFWRHICRLRAAIVDEKPAIHPCIFAGGFLRILWDELRQSTRTLHHHFPNISQRETPDSCSVHYCCAVDTVRGRVKARKTPVYLSLLVNINQHLVSRKHEKRHSICISHNHVLPQLCIITIAVSLKPQHRTSWKPHGSTGRIPSVLCEMQSRERVVLGGCVCIDMYGMGALVCFWQAVGSVQHLLYLIGELEVRIFDTFRANI